MSEKELTEVEIRNLSNKESKLMTIKMLNELRRKMDEHRSLTKRKYKTEPNRAENYNN